MAEKVSRQELELLLEEKTAHIKSRLDALQAEVSTVGQTLRRTADERPMVLLGGAIAVGLLAGLLFGGRRTKRDPFKSGRAHRELIDRYVESLANHARAAVAAGSDVGEAVETALEDRVPLIIYRSTDESRGRRLLSGVWDIVLSTVTSIGVSTAAAYLTSSLFEPPPSAGEEVGRPSDAGEEDASLPISGSSY